MTFIRSSLCSVVVDMLEKGNVLPPGFDHKRDDPFLIAPFTADDFKPHLRKVISHCWRNLPETTRNAWNTRTTMLNQRPVAGQFETIPASLRGNERSNEAVLRKILQKDYMTTRTKIDRCFWRFKNCKTIYNKVEHLYMDVTVYHKFYLHDKLPYSMYSMFFGEDYSIFIDEEKVSKKQTTEQ